MRPHTCPWPPLANQEVAQAPFRIPVLGRLQALTYLGGAGEMQWSIRDSFRGQHYVAKGSRFGFIRALSNWSFERKKKFLHGCNCLHQEVQSGVICGSAVWQTTCSQVLGPQSPYALTPPLLGSCQPMQAPSPNLKNDDTAEILELWAPAYRSGDGKRRDSKS